jgi:hypothetical protein
VARSIDLLLEKRRHLREGADGRLLVEVAAVELARLPSAHDLDAVIRALRAGGGAGASSVADPAPRVPSAPRSEGPPPRAGAAHAGTSANPVNPATSALASPGCAAGKGAANVPGAAGAESAATGTAVAERTAEGAAAAVSLARVLGAWEAIVAGVEARSRRLHACLARAKPIAVMGDVLLLALPETETVARAILRDRDAGGALREATKEVLGTALRPAVADGFAAAGLHSAAARGAGAPPASRAPVRPPPPRPPAPAGPPIVAHGGAAHAVAAHGAAAQPTPTAAAPAGESAAGPARAEDVRANPQVRAVLEGFGARLLAVERDAPAPAPPAAT